MMQILFSLLLLAGASEQKVLKEWSQIWKTKDHVKSLNAFHKKHGLFLPSNTKTSISFEGEVTMCSPNFTSLIKSSKDFSSKLQEIDTAGKVLNTWNLVTEKPVKVDGTDAYQEIALLEDPTTATSKTQAFILKINTSGKFEVLPYTSDFTWQTRPIDCPKGPDEAVTCVRDKETLRFFVVEEPCN